MSLKLFRGWVRPGQQLVKSGASGHNRRCRRVPRLESLESRVVLNADPTLSLTFFGSNSEGTTDLQAVVFLQDAEGGTFEIALDLNNDGEFGGLNEPSYTTPALGADGTFEEFPMLSWTQLIALNRADTNGLGTVSYPVNIRAIQLPVVEEVPFAGPYFNPTTLEITNALATFVPESVELTTESSGTGCTGGGGSVEIVGQFQEFGVNETVTVVVDWGDETVLSTETFENVNNEILPFAFSHEYASGGPFHITWHVLDAESISGEVIPDEFSDNFGEDDVAFEGGGGGPQTVCLDAGVLTVNGSTGNDMVTVTASGGNVQVNSNFPTSSYSFGAGLINQVVVLLGDGDDVVINSTTKAMVAVGGAGTDILTDAGGRSILIGGAGTDVLSGGGGQDILIDGSTDHDTDAAALLALLAEWNLGTPIGTRISNIMAGVGINNVALNGSTIDNDGVFDLLIGGGGTDWILLHSGDLSLGFFDSTTLLP